MAFMKPQSLQPLPRYYYSPTYRGAATDVSGESIETLYKSRKMEGTLGGVFNVLLAGERASGTVLYDARKKLGFGKIDWIEHAEPGTYGYRRISPSEALGIKGYDDKFWTARGITSLALDIVLDPTTYIGVGLVGKGAKLTSIAAKGGAKAGTIRVGTKGAQFLAQTQARGISRATAERKLVEYMSRSPVVHKEMMARTGPTAVKFMGRPVMATARITEPAGRLWRAAPMLETRTSLLGHLQTGFVPFHKLTQQVGAASRAPFREFYRATGVGRTQWDRYIQRMARDAPEEFGTPIAKYIERGELPTSNIDEIVRLAQRHQAEYQRMYKEKMSVGLLKEEQYIPRYMAHVPTEEAMTYAASKMPKLAGRRREDTAALYLRSLKSAKERLITEDVFAANVYMRKKTGIEQWFETDPFIALQKYGVEHIMGMQSEHLWKRISTQTGFKAAPKTVPRYTTKRIDEIVAKRVEKYQLEHPVYGKHLVARKAFESEEEEIVRRMSQATWMRPISMEPSTKWSPYERLLSITKLSDPLDAIGRYIKIEKSGLFKGKYNAARRIFADMERVSEAKAKMFADPAAQSRWATAHTDELRAMSIAPGEARALGAYTRQRIRELSHEIAMLPSEKAVAEIRVSGKAGLRSTREMLESETEFLAQTYVGRMFETTATGSRPYRAGEIAKISAPIRAELAALTKELPLAPTIERGGVLYQLEKGHYVPTEAFAEYTRRIPVTGWGSRLETKFKKTLTSIWPAFHARNLYGMVGWQNVLAGVGLRGYVTNINVLRKTSPWMAKHVPWAVGDVNKLFDVPFVGRKTAAEMRNIAEEAEIYGITGMVDVAATYSIKRGGIRSKLGRFYEQVPQEAMVGVESVGRGALFWDRVMKGMPIESAMKDVEKFHFRYGSGALTAFESDYMRHGFLFYRWMRGNIPLQAQMSLEKPYMYAGLGKLYSRGSSPDERERLQDWQKERFGFTTGNTFVSLDIPFYEHPALMLNPSNWEDLYFAMTPAIKFPVGILAGRDPATGAPIEDWGGRSRYAMSQFMGRGVYAQREIAKTLSGERPLSWTAIHQLGGLGIYETSDAPLYTGMTTMPRVPSAIRKMGVTQEKWTEYQMARGWTPRLTETSRAEIYQQHGGICSVCGHPCSPEHPCRSQLIVPVEMGGTYSPENTALVCDSCSGTFRRDIAPMMGQSVHGTQVPTEYRTSFTDGDRDRIYGVIDSYMSDASLVE